MIFKRGMSRVIKQTRTFITEIYFCKNQRCASEVHRNTLKDLDKLCTRPGEGMNQNLQIEITRKFYHEGIRIRLFCSITPV